MPRKKSKKLKRFAKFDDRKSRLDLLPPDALDLVGYVLGHGARKYAPDNWRKCKDPARYVAPILRHTLKHMRGEFTDTESGLPSLAHAICSGLFALDLYLKGAQDRFTMGNYFALVERKSKRRGVIRKRFNSYTAAFAHLEAKGLDPNKNIIKTVPASEKTGMQTKL